MQLPRATYWDELRGRLVTPDEPAWDPERFADIIGAGCVGVTERDTWPAPPPVFEEEQHP